MAMWTAARSSAVAGAALVALAAAWLGWRAYADRDRPVDVVLVDFAMLRLADTPNQHLVAPPGFTPHAAPMAAPPAFAADADAVGRALEAIVAEAPRARILARSPDGLRYKIVQRSALMNFPDYVDVAILPQDGEITLAVYSRSRFGHSDLGVNRARVERWLDALARRLAD